MVRGNRRRQLLIGGLAAVVVVVAALVVVWLRQESPEYDRDVARSTIDDFPSRGPLAGDDDLVERAADVWRDGEHHRLDGVPSDRIELLWAGEVPVAELEEFVAGRGAPEVVHVVVLRSGDEVVTLADGEFDGRDDFGPLGARGLGETSQGLIRAPGGLVLVSGSQASELHVVAEDGTTLTVEADDGLVSAEGGQIIVRVEPVQPDWSTEALPGIYVRDRLLQMDQADLDRVWGLLSRSGSADAVRSAFDELLAGPHRSPDQRPRMAHLEIVLDTPSPLGASLVVLTASAGYTSGARSVAAIDIRDTEEPDLTVTDLGLQHDTGAWVAAGWVTPPHAPPYLVVVGGDGTAMLQVFLGQQKAQLPAPGGVLEPSELVDVREPPPLVVAGFTHDGTVVVPMPSD